MIRKVKLHLRTPRSWAFLKENQAELKDKTSSRQSLSVRVPLLSVHRSRVPRPHNDTKGEITMTTVTQITQKQSDQPTTSATPDLASLKIRQQAAWSSGNYAIIGTTLQIVGEELCEALDLRST